MHDVYAMETTKDGVLGSGSYGTVCVATHRKTGQQFACKQLKLNRATPRCARSRIGSRALCTMAFVYWYRGKG